MGAYFGAALCVLDVNSDGLDDVLVGAPQLRGATYDEGGVYVYVNQNLVRLATLDTGDANSSENPFEANPLLTRTAFAGLVREAGGATGRVQFAWCPVRDEHRSRGRHQQRRLPRSVVDTGAREQRSDPGDQGLGQTQGTRDIGQTKVNQTQGRSKRPGAWDSHSQVRCGIRSHWTHAVRLSRWAQGGFMDPP